MIVIIFMYVEKLTLGTVMPYTVIPTLEKQRQENQFITLGCISSSKLPRATGNPVSKQQMRRLGGRF